ncbi:hypothetical protein Plim_0941 [Planctopirus limnophila DSM 3776]|uniref:Uncharacterized protein n=1 Tax=Planctopirus limnophila (strain ATCC 43296 / DSM 3776 / IFAM 1008 / Mu 290) TaxID=521674 RepID=D5ST17_PLAL2|nr:hypothetical protein [Planctopirus limnophila]ADG66785.1 hypothetical protein Plim_0941 [Planctopirus limnophila DSM 3776]
MSQEFDFAEDDKLKERESQLSEFLDRMFDNEDRPYFVSDDACLYDIFSGRDEDFNDRLQKWYGKALTGDDFRRPVWQLLDSLYRQCGPG